MYYSQYPSKIKNGDYTILKFGGNFSVKYNHKEFKQMLILHFLCMFIVLATLIGCFVYLVWDFSNHSSLKAILLNSIPNVLMSFMILFIVSYMMFMLAKKVSPPCIIELYKLMYFYKNKNRSRNTSGVVTKCTYDECIIRFVNKYHENVFIKIKHPNVVVDSDNKHKKYKYEINFGFEYPNSVLVVKS